MAVLTGTQNLCFEQKYEKYQNFSSENFHFLVVKFSIYLNRRVFVMFGQYVLCPACLNNGAPVEGATVECARYAYLIERTLRKHAYSNI